MIKLLKVQIRRYVFKFLFKNYHLKLKRYLYQCFIVIKKYLIYGKKTMRIENVLRKEKKKR